jgi:hypothetical protein
MGTQVAVALKGMPYFAPMNVFDAEKVRPSLFYWLLVAGCWLLVAGCCLAAGSWSLAAGCWLLAAGCWLLFYNESIVHCTLPGITNHVGPSAV